MKIALFHDWLLRLGGAEKVFKTLHEIFPEADVYTLFYDKRFTNKFLPGVKIHSTFLQKIPGIEKLYKTFLVFMPNAVESVDLSAYDVVISSSIAFSKGLVLRPKTKHISYCHSPTRFLWDWHINYTRERGYKLSKPFVRIMQHYLRIWDAHAANRVDYFIANSKNTQERIKKYYNQPSTLIYPPVETLEVDRTIRPGNYYLIVSQLLPHKNIDIAIDAFNKLGLPLYIVGQGPMEKRLKKRAKKNIKIVGFQNNERLSKFYSHSKAFVMPQEEEFGITAIEAMLHGRPVLALRRGGALEYILEGINGEHFDDPVPEVLADGVRRLNDNYNTYSPLLIRKSVERFSRVRFEKDFKEFFNETTNDGQKT